MTRQCDAKYVTPIQTAPYRTIAWHIKKAQMITGLSICAILQFKQRCMYHLLSSFSLQNWD